MEELVCYFNGQYVKESEVKIGIWDMGLWQGGIYEVARTYKHVPLLLDKHIDRLFRSLRPVYIEIGLSPEEVYNISIEVIKHNEKNLVPDDDFVLIYRVTRGAMPSFPIPPSSPTIIINCAYLSNQYEQQVKHYQEGVHLVVVSTRQIPPQCLDPKIKHLNRMCNDLAALEAKRVDPEAEALMLDIDGFATECPRRSFFMVKDGRLLTSKPTNCLGSITRATIIELAKELKIEFAEVDLSPYDLYNADEIFLAATGFVIYPVAKFNGGMLKKPIPGEITKRLFSAFSKKVGFDIAQRAISYVQTKAVKY
ncbi:aminotransferase class IV [Chloroflexota bacterium]